MADFHLTVTTLLIFLFSTCTGKQYKRIKIGKGLTICIANVCTTIFLFRQDEGAFEVW